MRLRSAVFDLISIFGGPIPTLSSRLGIDVYDLAFLAALSLAVARAANSSSSRSRV
jgi:hypothetical protein